ncbi:helix-turn-helix domain-containing protein [Streptomyces sp. 891-h]|uniref:helix-turn-helix domain-containing protein n=1 Tax=unclassified Streptomyces TaxID=2593676 RepID=UPI001FAA4E2D|nr:helix-turn-helix domain-containing protein [Streptomyces sp. 891-h]UNZ20409.1 helix-turn-helix domain-containing protein [Streptomyces sp. 891-h]
MLRREQAPLFGPELRRLRLARGLTLGQLSATVHYSKSQLSKVERGLKAPSPELARLCDAALGAEGALAALVPPPRLGTPTPESDPDEDETWLMHLDPSGSASFQSVPRRTVMAAGAASVIPLGQPTPQTDWATLLRTARSLFTHYRRLGQSAGSQLVLPPLIAQTHTLRALAGQAGPGTREALLSLASRYAEYIGWLVQETGDERGAVWWTDRAVELAEAGADHGLAAYALVRRALITLYRGDAAQTVELARRAQRLADSDRVRGLAAQREAQGHALAGDHRSCMRGLDAARALLVAADRPSNSDPQALSPVSPVIGPSTLTDPVSMITGWCLHDLGRPAEAAEVLDRETAKLPHSALRSQARYGIRRALAHATAGEIDHACALVQSLIAATDAVASATITTDLRRLAHVLRRHPTRATQDLSPWLATHI